MAGFGVLFGIFVLFTTTTSLDYKVSFGIASGVAFVIAVFLLFAIKDGKIDKKHVENLPLKYFYF